MLPDLLTTPQLLLSFRCFFAHYPLNSRSGLGGSNPGLNSSSYPPASCFCEAGQSSVTAQPGTWVTHIAVLSQYHPDHRAQMSVPDMQALVPAVNKRGIRGEDHSWTICRSSERPHKNKACGVPGHYGTIAFHKNSTFCCKARPRVAVSASPISSLIPSMSPIVLGQASLLYLHVHVWAHKHGHMHTYAAEILSFPDSLPRLPGKSGDPWDVEVPGLGFLNKMSRGNSSCWSICPTLSLPSSAETIPGPWG